jgi:hypothetical protein
MQSKPRPDSIHDSAHMAPPMCEFGGLFTLQLFVARILRLTSVWSDDYRRSSKMRSKGVSAALRNVVNPAGGATFPRSRPVPGCDGAPACEPQTGVPHSDDRPNYLPVKKSR